MTHEQAKRSLAEGVAPDLVCATCPWDRLCIEPPTMSSAEIDRLMRESQVKDDQRVRANPKALPITTLVTAVAVGGRDLSGQLCPVVALRLRGPDGRRVADAVRAVMQGWADTL